ncbi:MAG: hypothetical protein HRU41_08935 [Saprospiraceae bacterium]|nr:hypothetical protein [Saprospiraceae bacterium]
MEAVFFFVVRNNAVGRVLSSLIHSNLEDDAPVGVLIRYKIAELTASFLAFIVFPWSYLLFDPTLLFTNQWQSSSGTPTAQHRQEGGAFRYFVLPLRTD